MIYTPYARDVYTGDGFTNFYFINWPWLREEDIVVLVDDEEVPFTYEGETNRVILDTPPVGGSTVIVFRYTNRDEAFYRFTNKSILKSGTLDINFTQQMYLAQEFADWINANDLLDIREKAEAAAAASALSAAESELAKAQAELEAIRAEAAAADAEASADRIRTLTASASGLPAGSDPTADWDENTNNLGLGIPKGDKGDQGEGIKIVGVYDTVDEIEALVAESGDVAILGQDDLSHPTNPGAEGDGYVYDGAAWNNIGPLRGPPGEDGADGAPGVDGDSITVNNVAAVGGNITLGFTNFSGTQTNGSTNSWTGVNTWTQPCNFDTSVSSADGRFAHITIAEGPNTFENGIGAEWTLGTPGEWRAGLQFATRVDSTNPTKTLSETIFNVYRFVGNSTTGVERAYMTFSDFNIGPIFYNLGAVQPRSLITTDPAYGLIAAGDIVAFAGPSTVEDALDGGAAFLARIYEGLGNPDPVHVGGVVTAIWREFGVLKARILDLEANLQELQRSTRSGGRRR